MRTCNAPTAAEVKAARLAAGLTQTAAGAVIYAALRTWQSYEAGERKMPAAAWELWRTKIADKPA